MMNMLNVYSTGFFSLSITLMNGVAVPLWCVQLGMPPWFVGLILSARSLLPLLFSIQGGAIMDRAGVQKSLTWISLLGVFLPLFYPLTTSLVGLVLLELVSGLVNSLVWIGAQTILAQLARGDANRAGIFSFATNMGNFLGPLLVGFLWKFFNEWGGFIIISIWSASLFFISLGLPKLRTKSSSEDGLRKEIKKLILNIRIYGDALRLLKEFLIQFIFITTFLRIAAYTIQGSFYAVVLKSMHVSELQVGMLVGVSGVISGVATLMSGMACRLLKSDVLVLILGIFFAIFFISITPITSNIFLLFFFAVLHGVGMGVSLPVLISSLSRSVPKEEQGLSIGLRTTANRFAGLIVPIILGGFMNFFGIEVGFYIVGLLLTAVILWVVLKWRSLFFHGAISG